MPDLKKLPQSIGRPCVSTCGKDCAGIKDKDVCLRYDCEPYMNLGGRWVFVKQENKGEKHEA